jgi:hypothetical protein
VKSGKEKELINFQTGIFLRGTIRKVNEMDRENTFGKILSQNM